jgi:hypothetical protein
MPNLWQQKVANGACSATSRKFFTRLNPDLTPSTQPKPRYYSYLLRLWLPGDEGEVAWHASLDDPKTGERLGFPTLQALWTYLQELIGEKEE